MSLGAKPASDTCEAFTSVCQSSLEAIGVPSTFVTESVGLAIAVVMPKPASEGPMDVNASQVSLAGFAPSDTRESALYLTLQPGAYTVIVNGVGGTTGTGLVEVYTTP